MEWVETIIIIVFTAVCMGAFHEGIRQYVKRRKPERFMTKEDFEARCTQCAAKAASESIVKDFRIMRTEFSDDMREMRESITGLYQILIKEKP